MGKPCEVVAGATCHSTRRTLEGRFLLLPVEEIKELCRYCLFHAVSRYKIQLHGFNFLSNHIHLVFTDPLGKRPEFERDLNRDLAKCINAALKRSGQVWEQGSYKIQLIKDKDTLLQKLLYCFSNPVHHAIVRKSSQWPGVCSRPRHFEDVTLTARRPKFYFSQGKDSRHPKTVSVKLTVPKFFKRKSGHAFRELFQKRLNQREEDYRNDHQQWGRKILGREKLDRQIKRKDFTGQPKNPIPDSDICPVIACLDKERRLELIKNHKQFLVDHREARLAFQAGDRSVVFPYGTYWWRLHAGVKCQKRPPP